MILFGVPILPLTTSRVRDELLLMLQKPQMEGDAMRRVVVTPNPEMLLKTEDDAVLFALQRAHLHLPDGVGLQWATRYLLDMQRMALQYGRASFPLVLPLFFLSLGFSAVSSRYRKHYLPERITGTDTVKLIGELSVQVKCSIFLLGSKWPEEAATILKKAHPGMQVAGTFAGPSSGLADLENDSEIITKIQASGAEILLVAFGAPAQELWLSRNIDKLPNIRLAMGVGGAFDMLAGRTPRAPKSFQKMGLEWLWRLFLQPKRLPRIFNATVRFPFRCLRRAFHMALHGYRKNVIVFVQDDAENMLLVESDLPGPQHAWHFVQEGMEGNESAAEAALRGLREETTLSNLPLGAAKEIPSVLFAYEWPKLSHTKGRLPDRPPCVGQIQKGVIVHTHGIRPPVEPRLHNGKKELRAVSWVPKNQVRSVLYPTFRLQYDTFIDSL